MYRNTHRHTFVRLDAGLREGLHLQQDCMANAPGPSTNACHYTHISFACL